MHECKWNIYKLQEFTEQKLILDQLCYWALGLSYKKLPENNCDYRNELKVLRLCVLFALR